MHTRYRQAHAWTHQIIGSAMEVHTLKGPGLVERIYERCMLRELELRSIPYCRQRVVEIEYKGLTFREPLRLDLLIDDCLIVELKAVETLLPIHKAQLFSYMKLLDAPLGLLINFHEAHLRNGVQRMILPSADR